MPLGDIESAIHLALGLANLGQELHDVLEPDQGEVHGHKAAVRPHGDALNSPLFLQGGRFPGQRAFGQVALGALIRNRMLLASQRSPAV